VWPDTVAHDPVPPYPVADEAAGAPIPGRRIGWRRWLPVTAVITLIAGAAIGMLVFLGFQIGVTGLAIGLTAAILPVPLLASAFAWLDRYEPEPVKYLVFCFAWGAAVATAVALLVNTGAAYLFEELGLPDALVAVLIAPFIEESMKFIGPLLLFWRRRAEWSGITDGIVYCGLSALGFAMVENVLYLGGHGYASGANEYGPATGLQNVFLIFIVRILFTGFAHPLFTSMAGIGLGIAARSADRTVRWLAPIAGLLAAMILHGLFNLLPTLTQATGEMLIMLYGYLGFMLPFFFAAGRAGWPSGSCTTTCGPAGSLRRRWPRWRAWAGGTPPGSGPSGSPGRPGTGRCATSSSPRRGWRCSATACSAASNGIRGSWSGPGPRSRSCWPRSPVTGRSSPGTIHRPRRRGGTGRATGSPSRTGWCGPWRPRPSRSCRCRCVWPRPRCTRDTRITAATR
jgi:RsiW-degrading membrane proteinase PrsW (M82 family)